MAVLSHLNRVLIVEDEAIILMDIEQTLAEACVGEVVSAISPEEATAALGGAPFDAAILDLHLGRSGWSFDVARSLRARGVPFVFTSGSAEAGAEFAGVPLVAKPFSADALVGALLEVTTRPKMAAAE